MEAELWHSNTCQWFDFSTQHNISVENNQEVGEAEYFKINIIVFTWSPRLSPASAALLPISTVSTKIPNPLSLPPRRLKNRGESLEGFCRVICLHFALAAQAIFSNLRWPFIFCNTEDTKCRAMFLLLEMEKQ